MADVRYGKQLLPNALLDAESGNWVGPGRSAGRKSRGIWDRLSEDDLEVDPVDAWDATGKRHDIDYEYAQKAFLKSLDDLQTPASEAVKTYLRALEASDREIAAAAATVTADDSVGDVLRRGAQPIFAWKAAAQRRIAEQIENNPEYRKSLDGSDRDAIVNYFGSVQGIFGEDSRLRGHETEMLRHDHGDRTMPDPIDRFGGYAAPRSGKIERPTPPEWFKDHYERIGRSEELGVESAQPDPSPPLVARLAPNSFSFGDFGQRRPAQFGAAGVLPGRPGLGPMGQEPMRASPWRGLAPGHSFQADRPPLRRFTVDYSDGLAPALSPALAIDRREWWQMPSTPGPLEFWRTPPPAASTRAWLEDAER